MTSLQRVFSALSLQEPDRVPLFLLLTMHGARELGMSIQEYFSKAENVVEGQLRLRAKYHSDCIYTFFYASLEAEAWGTETIFFDDGPPNAGMPMITDVASIERLERPRVGETACLQKVLEATRSLKARIGDEAPLLGVVMSPFSLPVMQMGFERYMDLIHEEPDVLERLLGLNEEFCVEWANAQLAAGATALCYYDPVSSPTILPPELYRRFGLPLARRTIARFNGPSAIHLASGRCLPIVEDVASTNTLAIGVSAEEDLKTIKGACAGKLAVVGNLNAIEMRRWTPMQAEAEVKRAIAAAGPGGGFILSDNHGEIPWQVPDEVLLAISEAVRTWGNYPISLKVPSDAD
ncbi:MAG: methylcobamide--CoM methyltransferase MtbA [Spirochaetales bacterium]|nr:MAG: methylcobamide--CoM methyltransferase MtbA [Spirochaetales bacterium]